MTSNKLFCLDETMAGSSFKDFYVKSLKFILLFTCVCEGGIALTVGQGRGGKFQQVLVFHVQNFKTTLNTIERVFSRNFGS